MKITDVVFVRYSLGSMGRQFHDSNPRFLFGGKGFSFIEIHTDEGLTGIAPTGGGSLFVERIKSQIVGDDPLDSARLWNKLFMGWRRPVTKGPDIDAIGGVDDALWDLRGKILGLPVYRLLGGFRDSVPIYASGGYYADGKGLDELAAEFAGFVAAGYKAVKMKVGGIAFDDDVERIKVVRDAIGPKIELMIDANSAWNVAQATKFIRAVEQYDLAWVEEPVWADDISGAVELARTFDVPIASGEREYTLWGFRDLIDQKGADIIQADPERCGGLTEWMRIAAYASAHHLPMSPHGTQILGAHAVAAAENGSTVEGLEELFPWRREFIEPWPIIDGELVLPQSPGLGMSIDYDAIRVASV